MITLLSRFGKVPSFAAEITTEPSLRDPVSQACTQSQMADPVHRYWCAEIAEVPRFHRKQWEFSYILQALSRHGMVAPGMRGLGFGVGAEPLASVFAKRGAAIVATDLPTNEAKSKGWVDTDQHAMNKTSLNARGLCSPAVFEDNVEFRFLDMNAIPADLAGQFDFCWSACALEHLGSIEAGLAFILNSIACLKPGGVAVHTTELNCSSDCATLDNDNTVLFRRRDFRRLAKQVRQAGCLIDLNFNLGDQPLDQHVDVPPYSDDGQLKLRIAKWTSTSFGVIIKKGRG
jgi:2-polyprenyl-3-methyl-5-hydroxy-6-metoxy-1,4-benzoquinol methylase